jgi:hypothetical protein
MFKFTPEVPPPPYFVVSSVMYLRNNCVHCPGDQFLYQKTAIQYVMWPSVVDETCCFKVFVLAEAFQHFIFFYWNNHGCYCT